MHEEIITTTSTTSKFSNATVINSTSLHHQSHHLHDDGTITVSIVHPHHHQQHHVDLEDYNMDAPCSSITNQIVPSQTKIIVSSNDLHALSKDDVSSVIINGSLSNTNDPTVLILPTSETCDSDKNSLNLSQLTSSQVENVEIDVQDVSSLNDETSSQEGESNDQFSSFFSSAYSSIDAVAVV